MDKLGIYRYCGKLMAIDVLYKDGTMTRYEHYKPEELEELADSFRSAMPDNSVGFCLPPSWSFEDSDYSTFIIVSPEHAEQYDY